MVKKIKSKKLLQQEILAQSLGVRQARYSSVFTGLTPQRLSQLLRASGESDNTQDYLTLAEEMEERDTHYRSVLNTRKQQILGLPIVINSVNEDKTADKIKSFVESIVEKPKFKKMLFDLLDGLGKGYSVVEVVYMIQNGYMLPKEYIHRKPQWFVFDEEQDQLLLREDDKSNIAMNPLKGIVHIPQLKTGLPVRGGLARAVATMFLLKNYGVKDWANFLEVYGMPFRVGKYEAGASEEDITKLMQAVADIGLDGAAVIPSAMDIEFINGAQGSNSDMYHNYLKYIDSQVSKVVLGQTMTTDDGSSRSQSEVHNEVRDDIKRADSLDLAESINNWLQILIDYNFGIQQEYPTIEFNTSKEEDRSSLADIVVKAASVGIPFSVSDARTRLGLKEPINNEDIIKSQPNVANADNEEVQTKSLNSELTQEDEEEEVISNWHKIMEPIEEQLNEALAGSNTKEQAVDKITSLSLNTEYLEEDLAKQTIKQYTKGLKGN